MPKGRVTPKGQKIVQTELDSALAAQNDFSDDLSQDSMILTVENLNTATALLDASNERSRSEQRVQSADALHKRDALIEKMKVDQSVLNSPTGSQNRSQSTQKVESTIMSIENQSSTATTPDASNAHLCDTPGCIAHKTREILVGNDTFAFRVHFTPTSKLSASENLLDHATESVSRKVAQMIRLSRKENKGDGFPSGRIVDIDSSCRFARTLEDEKRDILAMSVEEREKYLAELMRRIEMAKSLQSV